MPISILLYSCATVATGPYRHLQPLRDQLTLRVLERPEAPEQTEVSEPEQEARHQERWQQRWQHGQAGDRDDGAQTPPRQDLGEPAAHELADAQDAHGLGGHGGE